MRFRFILCGIYGLLCGIVFDSYIPMALTSIIGGGAIALLVDYLPFKKIKIFKIKMAL